MPWTVSDVDKHKKGLSDKQKAQWCRIANSVLKRCVAKGGSEDTCAASAIKQANGVVNANSADRKYTSCMNKQIVNYEPEFKVHQDKAHLVVPVVMMVEGVHAGSLGPLYHKIEELGKVPGSWNGIPVVVQHPEQDGVPISANSPDIIDQMIVGRVYNTGIEGDKLKAEIWFDEERLNNNCSQLLADINASKEIEVSLGMFNELDETPGEWHGEKYSAVAYNYRPDHLAILPYAEGACSCKDGCGIGADADEAIATSLYANASKWLKLRERGLYVSKIGNNADAGFREKMDAMNLALRELNTDNTYHYLEDMTEKYVIYESGSKLYKQSYKFESGKVKFEGLPVEVHKSVEYVINFSINQLKNENMGKNEAPECVKKVNDLIANKESGFTEDDRAWLETLPEAALNKVSTPKIKEVEKRVEVNVLSEEDKAAITAYKAQLKEKRSTLIAGIQTNTSKEEWPDVVLNGMTDEVLERLQKSTKKDPPVDYSMNGQSVLANAGSEPALLPTGIEFKEVKK